MSHTFASRRAATTIRGRGGRQNFPTQTKLQPLAPRGKTTPTKSRVLTNRGRVRTAGRQTGGTLCVNLWKPIGALKNTQTESRCHIRTI